MHFRVPYLFTTSAYIFKNQRWHVLLPFCEPVGGGESPLFLQSSMFITMTSEFYWLWTKYYMRQRAYFVLPFHKLFSNLSINLFCAYQETFNIETLNKKQAFHIIKLASLIKYEKEKNSPICNCLNNPQMCTSYCQLYLFIYLIYKMDSMHKHIVAYIR